MKLPKSAYETGPLLVFSAAPRGDAVTPAVLSGYSESIPLPNGDSEAHPLQLL